MPVVTGHDARAPARATQLQGLAEWARANQALHDAIGGLAGVDDAQPFLAALLGDALRVVDTGHGAIALLEGEPGDQVVHHIVMLEEGEPLSPAALREHAFQRVPLVDALQRHAVAVAAKPRGVSSHPGPDCAVYDERGRAYLLSQGIRSVHSVALRSGERLIGWLGAGFTEPLPIPAGRIDMLCLLASQVAIAVELARLAEQARSSLVAQERAAVAQAQLKGLDTANRILRGAIDVMARESSLDAVLGYTLRSICQHLTDLPGIGMLWLADDAASLHRLHLVFEDGRLVSPNNSARLGEVGDATIGPASLSGGGTPERLVALSPDQLPKALRRELLAQHADQLLSFPVVVGGAVAGAFVIALPARSPVPLAENLRMAQALTQQCALALQMARWAEQGRRDAVTREREAAAAQQMAELTKINRTLQRSLDQQSEEFDVDETLGHILRAIADHLEAPSATLCMRLPGDEVFHPRLEFSVGEVRLMDPLGTPVLPAPEPDSAFWRTVVEQGKPTLFDPQQTSGGNDWLRAWCESHGVQRLLALPLVERGRATGCFLFRFFTPKAYPAEQLELLQTLSHHAALTVQLGRMHQTAQHKSEREATLAERVRIAREFHDTLAQGLTGILMHLQAAQRTGDVAQAKAYIGSALDAARTSFVEVRRSLKALRAMALEQSDFLTALTKVLKAAFAGTAVVVEITVSEHVEPVAEATESELLRIAQEAAANARRHAQASRFFASVGFERGHIALLMEDDGIGFDAGAVVTGYGLIGMRERAQRLGASLTLETPPGGGTRITVVAASAG